MSAMDPMLSATDLKEELRCVHATQHRTLNTAFYGTPTPNLDTIQVELERYGQVTFKVVHAPCELLARKALVDAKENALVMLIDFKDRLPLDLLSRLAGGKVRTITDERRLAHLFGAKSVSAEVLASPLRTALLASSINEFGTIPGTTLDLDTAWRKYLARVVALPEDAPMSEDRLIAHCAATPDQKGFRQVLASNPGLREGFLDFIGKKSGPIAQFAWRAWEAGRAREVAAFAFILQAAKGALHDKAYLDAWLSVRLGVIDQDLSEILNKDQKLIERWGGLADLLSLQFRNGAELDEILADAEKLLDEKIRNALGWSPYLPSSVQHGCQKLAAALTEALQTPTPERLLAMQQLLEQIEHHRLRDRERFRGQIERARMAARLVAFLSVAQAPLAPAPADRVCDLASFYSREGGFFDLARIRARGSVPLDELDKAIAAVVAKADKFRDDLDEQFAKALPAWMTHPKSERAVSIERVIDRFGVEFIAGGAHRRLLVLLLDGMAWADAVELFLSLEESHWGPVRWLPKGTVDHCLPPVLAALPTLTDVSRSALFGGKRLRPGDLRNSTGDPDRFDEHAGMRKLLGHGPKLLLRGDAEAQTGHISQEALALIQSTDRVVGIVLNVIDEQLSVGSGLNVEYGVQSLKALRDLLVASATAQRAILVLSDHGHVRGDRFVEGVALHATLSSRARELVPEEESREHELIVQEEFGWRAKSKNRLALLYREDEVYGSLHRRGAHGGASLAEVVAPAMLVASDDLAKQYGYQDSEVELRNFPRPCWWDLKLPSQNAVHPAPPQRKKPAATPVSPQLPFPASPATSAPTSQLVGLLRVCELYTTATKVEREFWDQQLLPVVTLLEEHGGSLAEEQFATRLGLLRFRVPSLVAELSLRLNIDQHLVLVHERAKGLIKLDCTLLKQILAE